MLHTPVTLSYLPAGEEQRVGLSSSLVRSLGISTNQPITLRWPGQSIIMRVRPNQSQGPVLQLPLSFADRMYLPDGSRIHLSYHPSSQTLKLRPVLAIMISSLSHPYPCGQLNEFMQEVIRVARQQAVVAYVVTINDLLPLNTPITGWTWEHEGWTKKKFPLPDVVYNRIPSRRVERSRKYREMKQILSLQNISLFNQTFLDKWQTHQTLSSNLSLQNHLPETLLFKGAKTLAHMLNKHSVIYLKPIHGSLGRGIYRIQRTLAGYRSTYSTLSGEIVRHFDSIKNLTVFLSKRIKRSYIVQEGIKLLHYNERPIDFRVLIQKNREGRWAVTSLVARIGPENRFVSNVSGGGEVASVMSTLRQCHIPNRVEWRKKMIAVAKRVALTIDQGEEGLFGELGVDLALTTDRKLYILEVNSKPSKTADTLPRQGRLSQVRPSVKRLLDYTLFLSTSKEV